MSLLDFPNPTFDVSTRPVVDYAQRRDETIDEFRARLTAENLDLTRWTQVHKAELENRLHTLASSLDGMRALVVIDGLDEVGEGERSDLELQMEALGARLTTSKIVASCRSGGYTRELAGFEVVEIAPLSAEQSEEVAARYVSRPLDFWAEVDRANLRELASRPLLLIQLAMVFEDQHELPQRPSMVCRRMVELFVRSWDSQRRVPRTSRYSSFLTEEKHDFLSHVAHYLTSRVRGKRFTEDDLVNAYNDCRLIFKLEESEARAVAQEIEEHTGLIVQSGFEHFEFSHLVLQEYLCAEYLVRDPHRLSMPLYLNAYPESVAVAIALSSNPPADLARLLIGHAQSAPATSLGRLFNRLAVERPRVAPSNELGVGLAAVMEVYSSRFHHELGRFLDLDGVRNCLVDGLSRYEVAESDDLSVRLRLRAPVTTVGTLPVPPKLTLENHTVSALRQFGCWRP